MTVEQQSLDVSSVSATTRLERTDGSVLEIEWDDSGQVTTTSRPGPGEAPSSTEVGRFDEDGGFTYTAEPQQDEQATSAFGAVVDRARFADGTTVDYTYDHDARLRQIEVRGLWGSQRMELWPDGSRALSWDVGGLRGRRHWDATGATTVAVHPSDDRRGKSMGR